MSSQCLNGVIAIEFFVDSDNHPQLLLEHQDLKQLNQSLSKDLLHLIPAIESSSMALIGALYQSNEILQPGFPIHAQLRHYINASLKAANFANNQLLIGAHNSELPQGFRPPADQQHSAMFYLPFVIKTDQHSTIDFFEEQLMHKGMGSVELLKELQLSFSGKIRHVNFMSVLDLAAMMHNHMQMAGAEPLWRLIEQSLFNEAPECKEETDNSNVFYLSKKMVFTPFFTEHFWLNHLQRPEQTYPGYLFNQRQYVSALAEHGLDVRQFLPETWPMDESHVCFASLNQSLLPEDFFKEEIAPLQGQEWTFDSKQHPQLGIIYFQQKDDLGGCTNYYPLTTTGINKIQDLISQLASTQT